MAKSKSKKAQKKVKGNPPTPRLRRGRKAKDKGELAEYVGNLVKLHEIQGAVLRMLEKSLNEI